MPDALHGSSFFRHVPFRSMRFGAFWGHSWKSALCWEKAVVRSGLGNKYKKWKNIIRLLSLVTHITVPNSAICFDLLAMQTIKTRGDFLLCPCYDSTSCCRAVSLAYKLVFGRILAATAAVILLARTVSASPQPLGSDVVLCLSKSISRCQLQPAAQ